MCMCVFLQRVHTLFFISWKKIKQFSFWKKKIKITPPAQIIKKNLALLFKKSKKFTISENNVYDEEAYIYTAVRKKEVH